MPAKIKTQDVLKQLVTYYNNRGVDIAQVDKLPISYNTFFKAMLSDDFISSPITIKSKWDGLIASGYIEPINAKKGVINTPRFSEIINIYTYTYTHTNTAGVEQ